MRWSVCSKKSDLLVPINTLEKKKIKKIWRNRVNKELKDSYKKIFKLIDKTIFLKYLVLDMFTSGD